LGSSILYVILLITGYSKRFLKLVCYSCYWLFIFVIVAYRLTKSRRSSWKPLTHCRRQIRKGASSASNFFEPHRTVRTRQYACQRQECQALRQRLNELAWHARNRHHDDKWYTSYYQPWRRQHPDYQKRYRLLKKTQVMTDAITARIQQSKQRLKRLLKDLQAFQVQRRKQWAEQEQQLFAAIRAQRTGPLVLNSG